MRGRLRQAATSTAFGPSVSNTDTADRDNCIVYTRACRPSSTRIVDGVIEMLPAARCGIRDPAASALNQVRGVAYC